MAIGTGKYSPVQQSIRYVQLRQIDDKSIRDGWKSRCGVPAGSCQRCQRGSPNCGSLVSEADCLCAACERLVEDHHKTDSELWLAVGLLHTLARKICTPF